MRKQDDKPIWYVLLLCCAVLAFPMGMFCGQAKQKKNQEPRIMSIYELQRAIGAKPDGIVGPDTMAKWEIAYANQESAKFMTPSGAKE